MCTLVSRLLWAELLSSKIHVEARTPTVMVSGNGDFGGELALGEVMSLLMD